MSRFSFARNGSRADSHSRRRLRLLSALGLLVLMALGGGVLPVAAATHDTQQAAAVPGSAITQAFVVGGIAFAMIIAVAGGVLFYTARTRQRRSDL
ncbi:hypothetical protein ABZ863_24860 [Saccharomonospora sp. NPDC046836]|uniref:hypothetical protein n=1 Tax=Saccharomonospora sp. NPDC046836 TaxID=3156921 RepID=UPI0033E26C5C